MPIVPFIPVIAAGIGAVSAAKQGRKNRSQASAIAAQKLAFQKEQQAKLDAQKKIYSEMTFTNPYKNIENPYEDLTVNQQQAEFMSQQAAQSRADVLGGLRGAAGGAGVAGLAQSLANQGALTAQRISASIGAQEASNQQMRAQGAYKSDMMERGGEEQLQRMEMSRQATLLGMEAEMMSGANLGLQQAQSNQLQAGLYGAATTAKAWGNVATAASGTDWSSLGGGSNYTTSGTGLDLVDYSSQSPASDRRLKKNINKIGQSPSGLNIYSFKYKDTKHGEGLFQGVMSDEIPQNAVVEVAGYDHVDYSKIDVNFKQI